MSKKENNIFNPLYQGIILLCKSAIKERKIVLPLNFSWSDALPIIKNHNLYNLIHFGCKYSDIEEPKEISDKFLSNSFYLTLLNYEGTLLTETFQTHQVTFIPVKGFVNKNRYPNILMRYMSDIDIFIEIKKYKKLIKPLMIKNGFELIKETNHEFIWRKNGLTTVELHKSLVPSYDRDFYTIMKNGFNWYYKAGNFLYSFVHFAKHYRDAGIGFNHLVEMEVIWDSVSTDMLEELHLNDFYHNVRSCLDFLFNDKEANDIDLTIVNYIFDCGEYGNKQNALSSYELRETTNNGLRKKAVIKEKFNKIFPPFFVMKNKYPKLEKVPFLLPVFWFYRCFIGLFKFNNKMKSNIPNNGFEKRKQELANVGLEYFTSK